MREKSYIQKITVLIALCMLAISACERKPDRLQYALEFAGKNRIELEKVLEHYKSDSLKYRAACFLIKNMPRWYAYDGWQLDTLHTLMSKIGARIEGDNNIKFSNPKLMAEIKDTIDYTFQVWESNYTDPVRYIRYVPPTGILQVAEIKLYEDTSLEKEIRMKPVTLLPYIEHVTDGDILSFLYLTSEGIIEPLVFALERPQSIRSIYYVTRTDDNYVWEEDVYELLYQDGPDGWKSLGTKTATSKHITFNAPKNALLWLRDKTKGREEQVFIYKHNRQWFNSDFK